MQKLGCSGDAMLGSSGAGKIQHGRGRETKTRTRRERGQKSVGKRGACYLQITRKEKVKKKIKGPSRSCLVVVRQGRS